MNTRRIISGFLTSILLSFSALAQTAVDEFERGNVLYREGKFEQATQAYEAILKQGLTSSPLYFNLGNSYYRLGKIAPAILAYERALRLQPNDADIKHNLALVNLKTVDRIEPLPDLFFIAWLRALSAVIPLNTTAWLFATWWFLLFGSLAALSLLSQQALLRLSRGIAIAAFIVLIPLTALMVTQIADSRSRDDAIITTNVVTAKTSPDAQSVDAFVVHEGLKVRLSDAVAGWMKIMLADGKIGWIPANVCERI
jgi:tetratricopeptide (TPR) repeat protein